MTKLTPVFEQRNYTPKFPEPGLRWQVDELNWRAVGGCANAQLSARGTPLALWSVLNYLRCPVVITDELEREVWWGYVNSAQVTEGAITYGVSLDEMANQISVAYCYVEAGGVGQYKLSTAGRDADSIAEYGTKERIISLSQASAAMATQVRDTALAQLRYPIPTLQTGSGSAGATLSCRGWYSTLDWLTYANSGTTLAATSSQIATICGAAACGQFLTAVDVKDASGVTSSIYRDGNSTGLAVVEELLRGGTSNNRRLLASVTSSRRLQIFEEPAKPTTPRYFLNKQGQIVSIFGQVVEAHLVGTTAVGNWAALKDVIPATVDVSHLADPSLIFIEEATWRGGALTVTPRDVKNLADWEGIA